MQIEDMIAIKVAQETNHHCVCNFIKLLELGCPLRLSAVESMEQIVQNGLWQWR
jgi:hypothetical protein